MTPTVNDIHSSATTSDIRLWREVFHCNLLLRFHTCTTQNGHQEVSGRVGNIPASHGYQGLAKCLKNSATDRPPDRKQRQTSEGAVERWDLGNVQNKRVKMTRNSNDNDNRERAGVTCDGASYVVYQCDGVTVC